MKGIIVLTGILCIITVSVNAQQRIERGAMNYIIGLKPNNIIYHDSLFRGRAQFEQLFYRTRNPDLMGLLQKHQSNKVAGQLMGIAGTVATIFGISMISSAANKGTGWLLIGGGFATTLTGGYLTVMGQKNLQMAVTLFNHQYNGASIGIGVSNNSTGLVFKW